MRPMEENRASCSSGLLCLLLVVAYHAAIASSACINCGEQQRVADANDVIIDSMDNELAVGEAEPTAHDTEHTPTRSYSNRLNELDEAMINKRQSFEKLVEEVISRTLLEYGYRREQMSNRTLLPGEVPQPLDDAVTSTLSNMTFPRADDPEEFEEDEEEDAESEAQTVVHLQPVPGKTNSFSLDLRNINVNMSSMAQLFVEVPHGVKRVRIFERSPRAVKIAAKRITRAEQDQWARLSIKPQFVARWRAQQNDTVQIVLDFDTTSRFVGRKFKPPYLMVNLMPVVSNIARRVRRNALRCNIVGHFINLKNLLGYSTFPEGANIAYCMGSCAAADRDHSSNIALSNHVANSGAIPHAKACCVPREYDPFSLLVLLDSSETHNSHSLQNHTVVKATNNVHIVKIDIPRLAAKSCSCL